MLNRLSPKQKKMLSYPTIFLVSIMNALSMHCFIIPNHFAAGGVGGIANMVQYATNNLLNSGILIIAINVPLVVFSFIKLGHDFTIKSLIVVLTVSASLLLLDVILPIIDDQGNFINENSVFNFGEQTILGAVMAGIIGGLSVAVMFKNGGTSGGTDFVAALIHKKHPQVNLVWFIFAIDVAIAIISIFVYQNGLMPVLLSLVRMFIQGKVCDGVLVGFKAAAKFEIITDKPEEVKQALFDGIGRGVTRIPAYGMYNKRELSVLLCVVRRREIPDVQEILRNFPGTFSIISETTDVYGNRFSSVHKGKSGM